MINGQSVWRELVWIRLHLFLEEVRVHLDYAEFD